MLSLAARLMGLSLVLPQSFVTLKRFEADSTQILFWRWVLVEPADFLFYQVIEALDLACIRKELLLKLEQADLILLCQILLLGFMIFDIF